MGGIAVQGAIGESGRKPTTVLSGFAFNSMATINGVDIGASLTNGLCVLNQGEKDVDAEVQRTVTFATTDFGIKNPKRIRYIYFGISFSSPITVSVAVDDQPERTYTLRPVKASGMQRVKLTIGHNRQGRYWRVKITSDKRFVLDDVETLLVVRTSGIKGY